MLRRDAGALRIADLCQRAPHEIIPAVGLPQDFPGRVKRSDDIRRSVGIKIVLGSDAHWLAAVHVHDPTHLPVLEDSCHGSVALAEEQLVGSEWKSECSVGPEIVAAAVRCSR